MTGKVLGKIVSAEYGKLYDKSNMFGLQLKFKCGSYVFFDWYTNSNNISDKSEWSEKERAEAFLKQNIRLKEILDEANVNTVSQLKDKPVELDIRNDGVYGMRILTEVL